MKSLIFKDSNLTVNVEYITDMINTTSENFTVSQINGLTSQNQSILGMPYRRDKYTLSFFKTFATNNNLSLTLVDYQADYQASPITLVAIANLYMNSGLGADNI